MSSRPHGSEFLTYMQSRQDDMIDLLKSLTLAESPSVVPAAQQEVRSHIAERLEALDFATRLLPGRTSGGQLYARPRERDRGRPAQLLLGHYDTVWPIGTLEDMPFSAEDNVIRGPGVFDMKGGVTQMVLALEALEHFGIEPEVTPVVFINSDEEIGSRDSRGYIRLLARRVHRVYVLEPSLGPSGSLKTRRKGVGRFTVVVKGKAAHAGLEPEAGASAILEMSHVIQTLFALNDAERGITVNVGTVDGGLRPNVIAPESKAVVDVRVATSADAKRIEDAILGLEPSVPGTRLEVEGGMGRPALEATPRNRVLWSLACKLGEEIGIELDQGLAGGGSDGSFTSQYTATLDGLGAVGDGAHAPHECLYVDKTLERAALLALLLCEPCITSLPQ